MTLTRREALTGTTASLVAIAAGGAVTAAASDRDADLAYIEAHVRKREDLRRGVQALVRMIRTDLPGKIMGGTSDALQQAADYLETLPEIEPVTELAYRPDPPASYVAKRRLCLGCGVDFDSAWAGERICPGCKLSHAFDTANALPDQYR